MERRHFISTAAAAAFFSNAWRAQASEPDTAARTVRQRLAGIERASGGRLGVALLDTGTGAAFAYRGQEAFPLCSTFKFLAAALVLARCDRGQEDLARTIAVLPSDLVPYAPVTEPRVGGEPMTVAELCEAAVTLSDNVAGNLLLRSFGGPEGLTAFARGLGDTATRLDRIEPHLNEAASGDPRDTTTPQAMLALLQKIVLGNALSATGREQIAAWLVANKTGGKKLRAGVPAGWRVGDKTGAGGFGANNDIAVLWPPGQAPLLVTCYLTGTTADQASRDRTIAEVGQLVASLASPPIKGAAQLRG